MTYNKKKSLYESIMKQVAQIVKNRINENFGGKVSELEDEIMSKSKETGVDFVDLDGLNLTVTYNYQEPDEAGRTVDEYPITTFIKSATINSWGVNFNCESQDEMGYGDIEAELMVDDILEEEDAYNALVAVRDRI